MQTEIITTSQMYWLVMLDNIKCFGIFIVIAFVLILLITGIITAAEHEKNPFKQFWYLCFMFSTLLAGAFCTLVPNTKQAAAIIIIPKIANNQEIQGLSNELIVLAKEWMIELKPNKEKL